MLRVSIVLFRGNSSSELNLIFIYFSLVINLIKSLILLHSSSCFLIFSMLSLVGTSVKYLFPLILISFRSKFFYIDNVIEKNSMCGFLYLYV